MGLVHGDVLEGDAALLAVHVIHAVDKQKRIAVRQELHDPLDIRRLQFRCCRYLGHSAVSPKKLRTAIGRPLVT